MCSNCNHAEENHKGYEESIVGIENGVRFNLTLPEGYCTACRASKVNRRDICTSYV